MLEKMTLPLPKKKYGNDMAKQGAYMTHTCIWGNGMERLGEDMELIWGSILPHFNVWKMYGKKS